MPFALITAAASGAVRNLINAAAAVGSCSRADPGRKRGVGLDIGRERPSKLYSSTRQDFADLDQPNLHVAVRDRSLHIQGLVLDLVSSAMTSLANNDFNAAAVGV